MIRSKVWLLAVVVLLQCGRSQFAEAGIVTWDVSGEVSFLFDPDNGLNDAISVGSPFFITFSYESTTPGTPLARGGSNGLMYEGALTGGSGQIGDLSFDLFTERPTSFIGVSSQLSGDGLGFIADLIPSGEHAELSIGVFGLSFHGPIGTFPDLALPLVPPSVEMLRQAEFSLSFFIQPSGIGMTGTITEIVPEPEIVGLMVTGALMILARASVKKRLTKHT